MRRCLKEIEKNTYDYFISELDEYKNKKKQLTGRKLDSILDELAYRHLGKTASCLAEDYFSHYNYLDTIVCNQELYFLPRG